MANEPPINCPGGDAEEVDAVHHVARCRCGIWFDTLMDEPTFPPHRIQDVWFVTMNPQPYPDPEP